MEYAKVPLSPKERVSCLAVYFFLVLTVSWLFFDSILAVLVLMPGYFLFRSEWKKKIKRQRLSRLQMQFLDGMQLTASSLQAGYAIENAFREAEKELKKVYGEDSMMVCELRFLVTQTGMNRPIEDLLLEFGKRSGIEDIKSFAEVFAATKRTGGDLTSVVRNTISCMRQRRETEEEIETCLAGKTMEQTIMSMVPVLILAYVRITSGEFLETMYGNLTGIAVMTVCLILYIGSVLWAKKIVQIEV